MTFPKGKSALAHLCVIVLALAIGVTPFSASAQDKRANLRAFASKKASELPRLRALAEARAIQLGIPIRRILPGGRIAELQRFVHGRPLYYVTDNFDAADTVSTVEV